MTEKNDVYRWYLVHTLCGYESKIKDILDIAGIESYTPIYSTTYIWKRCEYKKQVSTIPACLFIHIQDSDLAMVQYMREISFFKKNEELFCLSDKEMEEITQLHDSPQLLVNHILKLIG